MYAEEIFGKAYVAKRIHCRQHQSRCVMNEAVVTQSAAVPPELVEQATRGLLNMGFAKSEVSRAVHAVLRRHHDGVSVPDLIREALGALT